jgi:hypothetical protein
MMLAISQPVVDHSQAKMIKWKTSDQIPVFDLKKKNVFLPKKWKCPIFPLHPRIGCENFHRAPSTWGFRTCFGATFSG